jgi:hypothetical protein
MKTVVSVSLGTSKNDLCVETEFLGVPFQVRREGMDGDLARATARIRELDGTVDAIGLGGTDLYLVAGDRRYVVREALGMARAARTTPVVDGSGLKHTLERETIRTLQREGTLDFRGRKVLLVSAVDRFGMAEALVEAGADVVFGDLIYGLGIPVPIRSVGALRRIAHLVLPVVASLPLKWFYPMGEQQERTVRQSPQFYEWADVIAGDGPLVRRFMPERLDGKTILTTTVRSRHLDAFRQRGVKTLITTTPEFNGESFGTNAMEGVLIALLNKRPEEARPEEYLELVGKLGWRPRVQEL